VDTRLVDANYNQVSTNTIEEVEYSCDTSRATKLRDLCTNCDRSIPSELAVYDDLCLDTLSVAAGLICHIEFVRDQVAPRVSGATKQPFYDFRSPFLWSFIDIWVHMESSSMSSVAAQMQSNKDTLRRYWNNANRKGSCLTQPAVQSMERSIIDYLISSESSHSLQSNKTESAPLCDRPEKLVVPLHINSSESHGGAIGVCAVGEHVSGEHWLFKSKKSDQVVPLRRGFRLGL
jgi:hypothetical protein